MISVSLNWGMEIGIKDPDLAITYSGKEVCV